MFKSFYTATLITWYFLALLCFVGALVNVKTTVPERWARAWAAACLLAVAIPVGVICATYVVYPAAMITSSETGFFLAAWKWASGAPLYHPTAGPEVYSLLYGPLAFAPYAALLKLTHGFEAGKLLAIAVFGAAATIMCRRLGFEVRSGRGRFWIGAALGLIAIPQLYMVINAKSDPFLLLYASLPLLFRDERKMLVAAAAGCALTLLTKFTGVVAFLPFVALWWVAPQRRWTDLLLAVGVFMGIAAAGLALPGWSVAGFLTWVGLSSRHPMEWPLLIMILPMTGPVAGLSAVLPADRTAKWLRAALGAAFLLLLPASIKIGSGCYHFVPLLPGALLLLARQWDEECTIRVRWEFAAGATLLYGLTATMLTLVVIYFIPETQRKQAYFDRVAGIYAHFPRPFSVILSERADDGQYEDSFALATLNGASVPFSPVAMWDTEAAGLPLSAAAQDRGLSCATGDWIIPSGGVPWASTTGYYRASERKPPADPHRGFEHHLVGPQFVAAWNARFQRVGAVDGFDVYRCR